MKCLVVLCGLLAVASANPGAVISYSYANPAGVTFRGTGVAPAIGVAQPVAAPLAAAPVVAEPALAAAPVEYAAPVAPALAAPAAYAAPALAAPAYAHAPALAAPAYAAPALAPAAYAAPVAAAPAAVVQQHLGYVNQKVVSQVPGVAQVPVTKLALTQGVTQKLVDVAQPAVKNSRVKVRRPALRKEFYDIEHRIVVRPAGSATLELSQPIAKVQKGPSVITPTDYQQIAPVVRYGTARAIIDGPPQNFERSFQPQPQPSPPIGRSGSPPSPQGGRSIPEEQRQGPSLPNFPPPAPQNFERSFQPQQPQPQQPQNQPPPPQGQDFGRQGPPPPPPQNFEREQQQFQGPPPQQQGPPPPRRPLQLRPQGRAGDDAIEIGGEGPGQQQPFNQQRPGPPAGSPPPPQGLVAQARATGLITPDMPAELQGRLLQLLSAKQGSVTEILNENGAPANSASVLQVADALQDVSLQGGEKITTRRIVVTRPIETEQEVDIQEPATKIHRLAVNTPTLFKTPVQGIAQVPVQKTVVQNVATPFLKTSVSPAYAAAPVAYGAAPYAAAPGAAAPAYAY